MHGLCVGDREARADCQCGELIDRIAAGEPVRELLFVEALGDARVPFAGYRPDHRAGVELGTIDAHRAAEAAADLERRLDDRVAREARRDRFEVGDFAGWAAAGHSVPPRLVRWVRKVRNSMRTKRSTCMWSAIAPPTTACASDQPAKRFEVSTNLCRVEGRSPHAS